MKDRMKRLSILFLSASLCAGNVCAQEPETVENGAEIETYAEKAEEEAQPETVQAESTAQETESQQTESTAQETESQQTESAAQETESQQTESATQETESQQTESTAQETESQQTESAAQETEDRQTKEFRETENRSAEGENTENAQAETDTQKEEAETSAEEKEPFIVTDENGTVLKKKKLELPATLTVGNETHPVNYLQGVCKVTVPSGTRTLQLTIPDQEEGEEIAVTRWGGYLTEADQKWYLHPDDPQKDAYTVQKNTYTLNLDKFVLSMEEITKEQLAVYGDLAEETGYAEVLVTGEGRSELLLVEFGTDEETEAGSETEISTDLSEKSEDIPETQTESETSAETESEADIALFAGEESSDEVAVQSASASQVKQIYTDAGQNLSDSTKKVTPSVGSIGGEWEILGLSRSGKLDQETMDKYLVNVVNTLKENNGVLHEKRYTDYSRVILALTSLGVDVTNVGGYNLLKPLSDYDQTVWQGINGAIWALIAVDSHGYEFPQADSGKTQNSREKLIENILTQELSSGGWDLSGKSADPDITAMAIQSLAPYYSTNPDVKDAVDRGLNRLSAMQKSNGSYATYGSETSESCSQVIVALTAMGIDPNTDSRFVKNGKSVVDALLTYANADGSFRHVLDGEANQMATEQAYYALTAYERFTGGKTRLYDMTDVALQSDKEQAESVKKMIDALPETVKLTDKSQIQAAKAMYDALSKTQKALVTNYSKLESAVQKLQELEKNSGGSGNGSESGNGTGNGGSNTNHSGNGSGKENGSGSGTGTGSDTKKNTKKKTTGSTKKVNMVSGSGSGKVGGTTAGKTTSGQAADTKKKESEKSTEKAETEKKTAEKKGGTKTEKEVTDLITQINSLFQKTKISDRLPDDAADYTDVQREKILDIYRTYLELTDAQKKEVEQSSHYKDYENAVENFGKTSHYDETADVDLRENEEEVLPWYVQVEAGRPNIEEEQAEEISQALKGQGELLNLTDISLQDLLNHTQWEPEDLVRVSVPLTDLGEYENVAVAHWKEDGSLEFLEGHIAGDRIEFDTDQFSRFGVVGYHGSMEELMSPQEASQKPIWMYLLPGGCAAALLVILGAVRLALSGKKKGEDGER